MRQSKGLGKLGWMLSISCALAVGGLVLPVSAASQRPKVPGAKKGEAADPVAAKKQDAPQKDAKPAGKKADDDDKWKPQAANLETDDGVLIAATYFPSKLGKAAPAMMLLHGYGERQRVFDDLAFDLQDAGYAVLTIDFRGHGFSTTRAANPNRAVTQKAAPGGDKLDFHDLGTPKMRYDSLMLDIEAAKRFLVRRNNAGELNVAKLGVLGCEMGATMGILWSFKDWQYPTQVGFSGKQGQDVQSLVLISPTYNFKGVTISKELAEQLRRLPVQVVAGKNDPKAFGEAEKIYKSAKNARPGETDTQLTDLNTKLQGGKLLNPELELDVSVSKSIIEYLDRSLKSKLDAWKVREVGDSDTDSGR